MTTWGTKLVTTKNLASYLGSLGNGVTGTAIAAAHDTDAERETYVPARLSQTALKAALVPGAVYANDRTTIVQTKRLHVVLTADGTDIDDLIIETVG